MVNGAAQQLILAAVLYYRALEVVCLVAGKGCRLLEEFSEPKERRGFVVERRDYDEVFTRSGPADDRGTSAFV